MRIRLLYKKLEQIAQAEGIAVVRYTAAHVREHFSPLGAHTKYEIAQTIAN